VGHMYIGHPNTHNYIVSLHPGLGTTIASLTLVCCVVCDVQQCGYVQLCSDCPEQEQNVWYCVDGLPALLQRQLQLSQKLAILVDFLR
jgi:hypothetical protein